MPNDTAHAPTIIPRGALAHDAVFPLGTPITAVNAYAAAYKRQFYGHDGSASIRGNPTTGGWTVACHRFASCE